MAFTSMGVLIIICFLLLLLICGVPIGFTLALVGLLGYVYYEGWQIALHQLSMVTWEHGLSYTFACVPMFIMTGELASRGGFALDFYKGMQKWLSRLPGGLLITAFASCAGFAAVTGSSTATVASIGAMSYPALKEHSYDANLSLAGISAGGTLGILIPPSLGMVFYAVITEQSIGKLFLAGVIPGILLTLLFILTTYVIAILKPSLAPHGEISPTWLDRLKSIPSMSVLPFVFLIIIGGIYLGLFTPTEAGGCAVVFILICLFVTRRFNIKMFVDSLRRAGELTAMILTIVVGGILLARFVVLSDIITPLIMVIDTLGLSPYMFLLILIPIYCLLGMFLDIFGMMIVTVPVVFPIVIKLGINPIFFGVYITIMCEIALITPPVGVNTFVAAAIGGSDINVGSLIRWIIPYFLGLVFFVIFLTFFPGIALWLPGL